MESFQAKTFADPPPQGQCVNETNSQIYRHEQGEDICRNTAVSHLEAIDAKVNSAKLRQLRGAFM